MELRGSSALDASARHLESEGGAHAGEYRFRRPSQPHLHPDRLRKRRCYPEPAWPARQLVLVFELRLLPLEFFAVVVADGVAADHEVAHVSGGERREELDEVRRQVRSGCHTTPTPAPRRLAGAFRQRQLARIRDRLRPPDPDESARRSLWRRDAERGHRASRTGSRPRSTAKKRPRPASTRRSTAEKRPRPAPQEPRPAPQEPRPVPPRPRGARAARRVRWAESRGGSGRGRPVLG